MYYFGCQLFRTAKQLFFKIQEVLVYYSFATVVIPLGFFRSLGQMNARVVKFICITSTCKNT